MSDEQKIDLTVGDLIELKNQAEAEINRIINSLNERIGRKFKIIIEEVDPSSGNNGFGSRHYFINMVYR